jgi:hypothetical protein
MVYYDLYKLDSAGMQAKELTLIMSDFSRARRWPSGGLLMFVGLPKCEFLPMSMMLSLRVYFEWLSFIFAESSCLEMFASMCR